VELPANVSKLTALTLLDVGSNLLDSLPDAVGHLYALTELLAFRNELSTLPASLQFLTRPPPPPPSRTKWTRLVPPSILTGHL
jgi:Leucine-rich repeat (LRR) protein